MDLKGRTSNPSCTIEDILRQLSNIERKVGSISSSSSRDFDRLQERLGSLTKKWEKASISNDYF
jgi:hypothetical protein